MVGLGAELLAGMKRRPVAVGLPFVLNYGCPCVTGQMDGAAERVCLVVRGH